MLATLQAKLLAAALIAVIGASAGAIGMAKWDARTTDRLRVDLALEVGYVLWSVTARVDGQRPLSVAGPWVGLSLGVGAVLSKNLARSD